MSETTPRLWERGSRFLPFVLGIVLASASFAFLAWDLGHHRAPYAPHAAPSPMVAWFRYYWLVDLPLRWWLHHRRKRREETTGPHSM